MATIFTTNLFQLFLITHNHNYQAALIVKNYLTKEKGIAPKEIAIEKINEPCIQQKIETKTIGQFCVEKDGDLKVVKLDNETYEKIYSIY